MSEHLHFAEKDKSATKKSNFSDLISETQELSKMKELVFEPVFFSKPKDHTDRDERH